MPVKILILENSMNDFRYMSTPILQRYNTNVALFPTMNADGHEMEYFHYFLEEIVQTRKFKEIVSHYPDIDVFILDINLQSDIDGIGTQFYSFLRSINYRDGEFYVIEVSTGPSAIKGPNVHYVSKTANRLYFNRIIDLLKDLHPDLHEVDNIEAPSAQKVHTNGQPPAILAKLRNAGTRVKHTMFEHGTDDGIDKIGAWTDKTFRWVIHVTISLSFYLLMILAIVFGAYKIGSGFVEYLNTPVVTEAASAAGEAAAVHKQEMEIFKPAENIFLYLLPIFIIFGFYNYYKTNICIYLLEGNKEAIDEEKSTKSMSLTKMIFISSIISYLLIKCTEIIFYEKSLDTIKLIAAGTLLLMLMGYFVTMYRKEH